jgi:hypothetical protein
MLLRALAWMAIFAAAAALAACGPCGDFSPKSQFGACHDGPPPQ